MKTKTLVLLPVLLSLLVPGLAMSDCADFTRMTGWAVQGSQTILFFAGNLLIAKVDLQDCTVDSSSNIRLMKSYVCDSDTVLVNGQECGIMSLTLSQ